MSRIGFVRAKKRCPEALRTRLENLLWDNFEKYGRPAHLSTDNHMLVLDMETETALYELIADAAEDVSLRKVQHFKLEHDAHDCRCQYVGSDMNGELSTIGPSCHMIPT